MTRADDASARSETRRNDTENRDCDRKNPSLAKTPDSDRSGHQTGLVGSMPDARPVCRKCVVLHNRQSVKVKSRDCDRIGQLEWRAFLDKKKVLVILAIGYSYLFRRVHLTRVKKINLSPIRSEQQSHWNVQIVLSKTSLTLPISDPFKCPIYVTPYN